MNIASQFVKKPARKSVKASAKSNNLNLDISLIRTDSDTQSRVEFDDQTLRSYTEDVSEGVIFPPVVVYHDGDAYFLADGFHRVEAHKRAGKKKIAVHIQHGSRREAILFSVGANAAHGLRRSNEDKRRAVLILLGDAEWSAWSDGEIARRCSVSREFVNRLRPKDTCDPITSMARTFIHSKTGQPAIMSTAAIGKPAGAAQERRSDLGFRNTQVAEGPITHSEAPPSPAPAVSTEAIANAEAQQRARDALPQAIKDREEAKARLAQSKSPQESRYGGLTADQRIADLDEANKVLEAEVTALRDENKLYREMKVQFAQGGFEKVIADKDAEIRVLNERIEQESADKVGYLRDLKRWKKRAKDLGYGDADYVEIPGRTVADA